IEGAAVVFAAAGKACDCATHAADSRKLLTTIRTAIDESHCVSSRKKRQIVTTLLVNDSQVYTRLLTLGTVRSNPPPASAKLGENMRQLMPQSAIDFGWIFR